MMPGLDGTGPQGRASMSGGGFGYCTGYVREGELPTKPFGFRRGFFRRGFRGRWRRNMFYTKGLPSWTRFWKNQNLTREQEIQLLEEDVVNMEERLNHVRQRIENLKKEG